MALDKVSKNRTTITIAHRLSTIRKADNIIVMRKGKVVQQGTHDDLMADEGGAYHTLATAQTLSMADHREDEDPFFHVVLDEKVGVDSETFADAPERLSRGSQELLPKEKAKKQARRFGAFGTLMKEQTRYWKLYAVLVFGSLIGGGKSQHLSGRP